MSGVVSEGMREGRSEGMNCMRELMSEGMSDLGTTVMHHSDAPLKGENAWDGEEPLSRMNSAFSFPSTENSSCCVENTLAGRFCQRLPPLGAAHAPKALCPHRTSSNAPCRYLHHFQMA